jgi:hypothetical protein
MPLASVTTDDENGYYGGDGGGAAFQIPHVSRQNNTET